MSLITLPPLAQETFKIGVVSVLSRQTVESFELAAAAHKHPVLGGLCNEPIYVDEADSLTQSRDTTDPLLS